MRSVTGIVGVLVLAVTAACSQKTIASRSASPDGELEAVHQESSGGGATVGTFDDVYVHTNGAKSRDVTVLSGYKLSCITLSWTTARHLVVTYFPRSSGSVAPLGKDSVFSLSSSPPDSIIVSYARSPSCAD